MKVPIQEIASFSKGKQINGSDLIPNGKYDFLNGGIHPSGKWSDYNVQGDTVTVSEGGNSCGYVNYMTNPFCCGAHCYYFYDLKVPSKYFYYALKSQQDSLMGLRSGACMPNIKMSALSEFEIPITFRGDVQENIVANLDKVSALIALRKQQLAKLDELVKARFVEMFGTYPANEKGWQIGVIRDIVKDVRYGSSRPAVDGGAYPYLRMNNITYDGRLDLSNVKRIDVPENELKNCTVQYGDVLFNRTNSKELVGKTCVYNRDEMMVLAGFVVRVRVNEKATPEFLSAFLNTDFSKRMLFEMCKAAIGQANINAQEMQDIAIYIPPIELQKRFSAFVEEAEKIRLTIRQGLDKMETLKQALMQEYFG